MVYFADNFGLDDSAESQPLMDRSHSLFTSLVFVPAAPTCRTIPVHDEPHHISNDDSVCFLDPRRCKIETSQ